MEKSKIEDEREMNNKITQEVNYLILKYFDEHNLIKSFETLSSEGKLYFDEAFFIKLINDDRVEEAINYVTLFLEFVLQKK